MKIEIQFHFDVLTTETLHPNSYGLYILPLDLYSICQWGMHTEDLVLVLSLLIVAL